MATQLTTDERAARLREKLRADRDRGDRRWWIYSIAARIEALQEAGLPWSRIDEQLDLSGRAPVGWSPEEIHGHWNRILNQDDDLVAAARSILEDEESDS